MLLQLRCIFISSRMQLVRALLFPPPVAALFRRAACINIAHAKLEITDGCRQKMLLPQPLTSISPYMPPRPYQHFPPIFRGDIAKEAAKKYLYYIGVARSMFVHSSDINKSMYEKAPHLFAYNYGQNNSCHKVKKQKHLAFKLYEKKKVSKS